MTDHAPATAPGPTPTPATDRILLAAAETFATDGLDVSLEKIAERAGVGVGSIYRRFGSKDDIIQAVTERQFREVAARMRTATESSTPWEAFADEFRASTEYFAADRGFRELVTSFATDSPGWARGTKSTTLQESFEHWSQEVISLTNVLVTRARESGQLRDDIDGQIVFQLSLAVQGVSVFGDAQTHHRAVNIILDGMRA